MDTLDTAIKALKDNEGRDYVVIAFEESRVGIYSSLPNNDAVPAFLREVATAMEMDTAGMENVTNDVVEEPKKEAPKKARKPRKSNK